MRVTFQSWPPAKEALIQSNGKLISVPVSHLEPHELDDLCNRWRAAVWAAAKQTDPYAPQRPKKEAKK